MKVEKKIPQDLAKDLLPGIGVLRGKVTEHCWERARTLEISLSPGLESSGDITVALERVKTQGKVAKASAGSYDPNLLYRALNSYNNGRKLCQKAAQVSTAMTQETKATDELKSLCFSLEKLLNEMQESLKPETASTEDASPFVSAIVDRIGTFVVKATSVVAECGADIAKAPETRQLMVKSTTSLASLGRVALDRHVAVFVLTCIKAKLDFQSGIQTGC